MRKDVCKHFNGIQHGTCESGADYHKFRKEGVAVFKTFPCFVGNDGEFSCPHFQLPSRKELEDYEAEVERDLAPVSAISLALGRGEKGGSFKHHCGGTIKWEFRGSLAASAKCDGCDWSMIS